MDFINKINSNKRKPLFSSASDDSIDYNSEYLSGRSFSSNMRKRARKKKAASSAKSNTKRTSPRHTNTKTASPAVNTSNSYAVLTDNEDENIADNTISKKPKAVKIPPIICIDTKYDTMIDLMKKAKIESFSLKYISMGMKIFCTTLNDYNNVRKQLENFKIQHYTHDVAIEKRQKFVLTGLPNFATQEILSALQREQLDVVDVKKMKTKFENENYALFLVYFNNGSTTLQSLRRVHYILNVSIGWKAYQQARNGPTQCNNCQLYGHGNKNCKLEPRCAKCGLKHQTSSCMKDQHPQPANPFVPKCCLCGGEHSSKDRSCPKRISYMNMKINQSKTTSRPANAQNRFIPPSPPVTTFNNSSSRSSPVSINKKYSDWFKPTHPNESNAQRADDLLSNELLTEMMVELFQGLRASKTRLDQIQTVATVVLKYSTISNHV